MLLSAGGQFGTEFRVPGMGTSNSIDVGDFNGDGNLDAVEARGNQTYRIYLGDGLGEFLSITTVETGVPGRSARVAELTGDGVLDFVVANPSAHTVTLHRGVGDGTFVQEASFATGTGPREVVVADLDRDGHLDLATIDRDLTASLSRLLGDGAGGFETAETVPLQSPLRHIRAGDFDDDGTLDFVGVVNEERSFVANEEYLHWIPGEFIGVAQQPVVTDVGFRGDRARTGDFNGDGHLDLGVEDPFTGTVNILLGDGNQGFLVQPPVNLPEQVFEVEFIDLDLDGNLDVVGASVVDPHFVVAHGNGNGDFVHPEVFRTKDYEPGWLEFGDLNGDGYPDIVVGRDDFFTLSTYFAYLLSDGAGGFLPLREKNGPPETVMGVALGDFDEDGHLDVVVGDELSRVHLYRGDGAGNFTLTSTTSLSLFVNDDLDAVDLDEDGHLDLISIGRFVSRFRVALGDGKGSFAPPIEFAEGRAADLTFADLDEDGNDDLLVTVSDAEGCAIYRGMPGLAFEDPVLFSAGEDPRGIAVGDFDEDGHQDLATVARTSEAVSILRNRTFDDLGCRVGSVNGAVGPVADVLFVNGSPGTGPEREVRLSPADPFELTIENPPSRIGGRTRYVIYCQTGSPDVFDIYRLPFGLGNLCVDSPLTGGAAEVILSTVGRPDIVGVPTIPTERAPAVLQSSPGGLSQPQTLFYQGVILDADSPQGQAAVTNGVLVIVE